MTPSTTGKRPSKKNHENHPSANSDGAEALDREDAWEPPLQSDDFDIRKTVVCLADVDKKPVRFLWHRRLIRGAINLVDGDPGLGKSFISLDVAARVSTGRPMPEDQASHTPGNVLLLSHEDDSATTIRPRLEDMGANLKRVFSLDEITVGCGMPRQFTLPNDCHLLERIVKELQITLIVIDPLLAFFDGSIDAHKDAEVRKVMYPLRKLAERTGVCILAIRHLNKNSNVSDAIYRGGGSIAISGASRSVLIVAKDPDNPERQLLGRIKGNLCANPTVLAYSIEGDENGDNAVVKWEGAVDTPVSEFLVKAKGKEKEIEDNATVEKAGSKILLALDEHDPGRLGLSQRKVRDLSRLSARNLTCGIAKLIKSDVLEAVEVTYISGHGAKRTCEGIRRKSVAS